jgi:hypothetical protein
MTDFPHFEELAPSEAHVFHQRISAAKKANPYGAAVDVHKRSEYKTMKMFMTRDGTAGYAVKPTGELTSVFKHPDSPYKNVSARAAEHAVLLAGATHASAFDPLPGMYQKGGATAVSRSPWEDQYKPSNWKVSKQGRPDVSYMSLGPKVRPEEDMKEYIPGSKPYAEDYDSGMEAAKAAGEARTSTIRQSQERLRQRQAEFGVGHDGAKS